MDKKTYEAILEMKYLFESGVSAVFLSLSYPMSSENIEEFCKNKVWDTIDWQSEFLNSI